MRIHNSMRIALVLSIVLLPILASACGGEPSPLPANMSNEAASAIIGSPCVTQAQCPIGTCSGFICKGADGDPCTPGAGAPATGDTSLCLGGYACHACDVARFGPYECHCSDPVAKTGCAVSVCLSPFDACASTPGHSWNATTQTCSP